MLGCFTRLRSEFRVCREEVFGCSKALWDLGAWGFRQGPRNLGFEAWYCKQLIFVYLELRILEREIGCVGSTCKILPKLH